MSKKQIRSIANNSNGDHLFVKFVTAAPTTITPMLWSVGPCVESADEIFVNDYIQLQRNASSTAWRVNVEEWAKQDVKLFWEGTSSIKMYLCDTCKGFSLSATNAHVKIYKELSINMDGSRDTVLFTKDELAAVAQYADADGFMYFRFNNSATGSMIVIAEVEEPIIPDPVYTSFDAAVCFGESYEWNGETYSAAGEYTTILQDANGCNYQATLVLNVLPEEKPEEDGTILLNPTDELVLNLDSAVNVYRTDYDVWSAAKVQLGWYGDKPLHVFVSKDKDFFVAIYHEDVVLYQKIEAVDPTSVEPQVLVLDMSALRAYVNDGKLYVRFLTDSDARLVIEPLTE